MTKSCVDHRRPGTTVGTGLLMALVIGISGCTNSQDGPIQLQDTFSTLRANIARYRPDFLTLKSSTDLGYRALTMQDYDKAAWHLEFEVENKPDEPAAKLYLGQVYAATGRTADAQRMYQAAMADGGSTSVERDSANAGRLVSEVAAERLAALGNPPGTAMTATAETQAGDNLESATVTSTIAPATDPMTPAEPQNDARAEDMPETVVISAAPRPVEPAATAPEQEVAPPEPTTAIHLASYKRRARADKGWDILRRQHPALSGLSATVVEADLGKKGVYYRLVADGSGSAEEAREVCRTIKSQGHDWCQIGRVSD